MKKNFLEKMLGVLLLAVMALAMGSCKGCSKSEGSASAAVYHDYDGVVQDFTAGVAQIQGLHRQTMYSLLDGGKYQWRNSRVIFNDTITMKNIDEVYDVLFIDAVTGEIRDYDPAFPRE